MKILFTGTSSFTGYWFIKELAGNDHHVFGTFTQSNPKKYDGVRKLRVQKAIELCTPIWKCKFGDDKFIEIINKEKFYILCHHAADVTNYKSLNFDLVGAVKNNTNNIKRVFESLVKNQCRAIILTGSIFEQNEGCGSKPLRALLPYGLSKGLTYEVFKYFSQIYNLNLGKFVIPNPFGPYEELRFTTYLIKKWVNNERPIVRTPKYIRDNIHVSLLAKVYSYFVDLVYKNEIRLQKINPSGYVESQGDFTKRFVYEIRKRTNLKCEFDLYNQTEFPEPAIRVNTDVAERICHNWDEEKSWDELANYYKYNIKNKSSFLNIVDNQTYVF